MNKKQNPEAHRLAEQLRDIINMLECDFADDIDPNDLKLAAAELESLHARVQELETKEAKPAASVVLPEPFGYFKPFVDGWMDCKETDEGARPLYEAPQPQADARDAGRSDAEIVAQTEALARHLLSWRWGQVPEQPDTQMRNSENPRAQSCWQIACDIQALITYTDAENAAVEVDAEVDAERWVSESTAKPLESDGEVFVRFSDGTIGTGWASYRHGASSAFAQWSHPDPEEDRTVTHWMKPPAIDAAIAAAKESK